MNKFKIQLKNGREESIDAERYIIEDGFLTFQTYGINVLSIKHNHVELVRFESEVVKKEDLENLMEKFEKKYD